MPCCSRLVSQSDAAVGSTAVQRLAGQYRDLQYNTYSKAVQTRYGTVTPSIQA